MKHITFAIPVCDEVNELGVLLKQLTENNFDDIVVQIDTSRGKAEELTNVCKSYNVSKIIYDKFVGDFSKLKNNLLEYCDNGEDGFIFLVDADEVLGDGIIKNLQVFLTNNDVDLIGISRVNTLEGITDQESARRLVSNYFKNGRQAFDLFLEDGKKALEFPDYQFRIIRKGKNLRYSNRVHEQLISDNSYILSPAIKEYSIMHHKTIERQNKQLQLYSTLGA